MKFSAPLSLLVVVLLFLLPLILAAHDSILFRDIKTLVLHKGRLTRGGRSAPIQQINCVGGDACKYFTPEVIRCSNIGSNDQGEPQWKCQAEMENLYRLGRTSVSCEGYSRSGDPVVLVGSCGVEYTLHLTEKGKDRHLRPKREIVQPKPQPVHYVQAETEKVAPANNAALGIIMGLGLSVVFILVVTCCIRSERSSVNVIHSHPVPSPRQPTAYVEREYQRCPPPSPPPSRSDFFEGYMMGSVLSSSNPRHSPPRQRQSTTTIIHNNNNNSASTAPPPVSSNDKQKTSKPKKKTKSSTYTSTGYGGSVSRGNTNEEDSWWGTSSSSSSSSWGWGSSESNNDDSDNQSGNSNSSSTTSHTSTGYGGSSSR